MIKINAKIMQQVATMIILMAAVIERQLLWEYSIAFQSYNKSKLRTIKRPILLLNMKNVFSLYVYVSITVFYFVSQVANKV